MRDATNVLVKHVRDPLNYSRFIATVAAVNDRGTIRVGFSQCHPDDQFSKVEGRNKAIGRACALEPVLDKEDRPLRPVPLTFYNPDGTKYKQDLVMDECRIIAIKAARVFLGEEYLNFHQLQAAVCEGRR